MKQLCDDLRQFANEVYQLGFSLGGAAERECLDLSERMLTAVNQAEATASLAALLQHKYNLVETVNTAIEIAFTIPPYAVPTFCPHLHTELPIRV